MTMIYKDLLKVLLGLSPKRLNDNVTIIFQDEFYPVEGTRIIKGKQDILDKGHLVLMEKN